MIVSQTDTELQQKQMALHRAISADADSSNSEASENDSDFDGEEIIDRQLDHFASAMNSDSPNENKVGWEEEKKRGDDNNSVYSAS